MLASKRAHFRLRVCVRSDNSMSICPAGNEFTNSVRSRAGTVILPSSSTRAPIQQLMPISKLVAASRNRPPSDSSRMLARTGSVDLLATARPTVTRPLARFSCRQLIFIAASFPDTRRCGFPIGGHNIQGLRDGVEYTTDWLEVQVELGEPKVIDAVSDWPVGLAVGAREGIFALLKIGTLAGWALKDRARQLCRPGRLHGAVGEHAGGQ